ncbi:lysozyme family protein [Falsigemmobacter faecalis]|uniref:Lytic transglycosylase domain-containing protein n=1 Tax=Falsigemmobacter faecalis TaxID=2488730 RepID=A0A3P3DQI2_9RHOB|nr:lytic transglycosylase domain-containing protein [Falsigemmobacter faecalis]RRH75802.1 lytic transglycosylase domain-containing protein [Falsigemmobacter faecalis]
MRGLLLCGCLAHLGFAQAALAWTWLSAPVEAPPAARAAEDLTPPPEGDPGGLCLAAILAAEAQYQIPNNLLLALGLQEAGYNAPGGLTVWPWSVNAAGEGRRFDSREEAMAFVRQRQSEGVRSIDLGCLQINLRWHPEAFLSLAEGFDPVVNVSYAARFLRGLYDEAGSWQLAAGRYHSHSPEPQQIYLASLARNQAVATARFSEFHARASALGGADWADTLPEVRATNPGSWHTEGAIWGAAIAGEGGARRTLYSALDLEPVLPAFLPPES